MARIEFAAFGGRGEREASFEMGDQMRDAVGAHDRQGRIELSLGESLNLVERALGDHRLKARIDARIEGFAVGGEEETAPFERLERGRGARALEGGERPAGRQEHFEGAQNSLSVRWSQSRARFGICRRKLGVQVGCRAAFRLGADSGPEGLRNAGMSDKPLVSPRK